MKAREIGQRILAVLMMVCIFSGIILMMCESEDWVTQQRTLFGGMALFIIGAAPGLIVSIMNRGERVG